MKSKITTQLAPPVVGPYSQAIIADNLIFLSGQIHINSEGKLVEGTIEDKTHQVMKNLLQVLKATNADFTNVVKSTIYVTNMVDYGRVNEVYASYLTEPYPARETVCVKELPAGANVEISLVAMKAS